MILIGWKCRRRGRDQRTSERDRKAFSIIDVFRWVEKKRGVECIMIR